MRTREDMRCWCLVLFASCLASVNAEVQWPGGTYGLPMPVTGCPSDGVTAWKTGWTYHDTEDDNNENQRSNIFHMPGNFSAHGIQQKFCLKDSNNGNSGSEIWPEGKYCLYKKGVCPSGLKEGFIRWDDEQSEIDYKDKHFGDLPDGVYEKSHTTIKYCCSTKGNVNNPIQLPALRPFYLLTYDSAQCQKVAGTKVISEFIKFDDDDQGNTDAADGAHPYGPSEDPFNLKIYYCYYEPGQESEDDLGTGKDVKSKIPTGKTSSSGLAVAIGCGVAGAIVGTASIAFATKRILAHRARAAYDLMDDPQPDGP